MLNKKTFTILLLLILTFLLIGCSKRSAGVLETGKTYFPAKVTTNEITKGLTTKEIIEVEDEQTWIIKDKSKDDTNYIVAKVSDTGEKIGDYNLFTLTAEEIYGDIDDSFAPREGESYVITEDEEKIYFTPVNYDEYVKALENGEDFSKTKDTEINLKIKDHVKYQFEK
ncbi:hypothetical protein DES36_11921 [Alkalibaculum bacchi]|uniref:Lipoprotein n=1 Tax=Alkalibaculum bacchi TaxID=645887 RepID=A0A366HYU8_9FIRM|nr:hypothetical protein [Alkalibaculum bacchi]RBP59296.1 hypothetical protein DES36_11921 [Alkalibaculum bacchi]